MPIKESWIWGDMGREFILARVAYSLACVAYSLACVAAHNAKQDVDGHVHV